MYREEALSEFEGAGDRPILTLEDEYDCAGESSLIGDRNGG